MMKTDLVAKPEQHLAPAHPQPNTAEMQIPFPMTGVRVACDGGGGALGHPRVWLTLDEATRQVRCSYCSRLYVEDKGDEHEHEA